jgi:hypothetical protein
LATGISPDEIPATAVPLPAIANITPVTIPRVVGIAR